MEEEKDPNLFQIVWSMLVAFFGVQNKEFFEQNNAYIEKNGITVYINMDFYPAIGFALTLLIIVNFVIP